MSLVAREDFQHIIRVLNTNIDGKRKVPFALTAVKGVGRRYAVLCCKKAEVDPTVRAGELSKEEIEKLVDVISNPLKYNIPNWFLNRQRDFRDNSFSQIVSNDINSKLRDDLERLRKIRAHRGIRHMFGVKVRGQRTKSTGRHGRTVGVAAGKK